MNYLFFLTLHSYLKLIIVTLKYSKKILLLVFFLFCIQKQKAQCMFLIPTAGFNCQTGASFVSYSITSGGTPNFTVSITNSSGIVVSTGTTSSTTGTLAGVSVGVYTVTAVDALGCSVINPGFIVTVPFNASNIAFTTSLSCFGGNTGVASIMITGNTLTPPFTYTWSNGTNSPIAANLAAGLYSVIVKDIQGCTVSNSVTIGQNTQISSTLNTTLIPCYGGTINSGITSNGGVSPFSYTVNATALTSSTASNISAGTTTIIAKDANGCVQTNSISVAQVSPPIINFLITQPSCPGSTDGMVNTSVSNAPPAYTYTWQPIVSFTNSIQNIASGNYSLTIKDGNACITKSVVSVAPASSMSVSVITHSENCSAVDGAATITVVGGSLPYSYSTMPISVFSNTISNVSSGTYTTVVSDGNGCKDTVKFTIGNLSTVLVSVANFTPVLCYGQCSGKLLLSTLNAIPPITYSASGTATTTSNLITGLCPGLISVKVVDAIGCPATTTINFTMPPVFSYSAAQPPNTCIGKPVTLQADALGGTGNYSFVWNPGNINGQVITVTPNASTVYSLNVYDGNGCTLAPFQVTTTINPPITININNSNTGICPGTTAQITPTISGGDGNYSYSWLPGNTNGTSIFVENITVPVYTLTVNDVCGSPTAVKVITVNLFPVIIPNYIALQDTGCEPFCTQFVNTTPKSTLAIWNYGDKPYEQIGNNISYCYEKAGLFNLKLTVTDSNFCKTSFTYTNAIKVLVSPIANFTTVPAKLTLNNCDNFTLKNITQNAVDFKWTAEGIPYGTSTDINNYTLHDTGCYYFKLIARNQNNCFDTSEKYICVIEGFNFYMPDCFTPNDDNLNEILKPIGTGWTQNNYLFEVYNRWGGRVFKTEDTAKGWDGKASGDNYDPANVYYWRVKITDNLDEIHLLTGHVMLAR